MNIKKILFVIVGLCTLLAGVMVIGQLMNKDEEVDNNTSIDGGKTNPNNSSTVIDNNGSYSSPENSSAIISGGQSLVDSGLVESDENLFTEAYMLDMATTFIDILKGAYGENYELAGNPDAIYKHLSPYFNFETNKLVSFADSLAKNSNRVETRLSASHTIHSVKQLDDNSFAVYFYVKGDYTDEKGNLIESIEAPYHIMTLTKNKKDVFKVTYISASKESYILYDEEE